MIGMYVIMDVIRMKEVDVILIEKPLVIEALDNMKIEDEIVGKDLLIIGIMIRFQP